MSKHPGQAKIKPANPEAIFLPYQTAWVTDGSRLKLMEKSRQIGMSWATAYATVERTGSSAARHDQWVSSRDDLQARLFVEDCKLWATALDTVTKDLGTQAIDDQKNAAHVLQFKNGKRIYSLSSNADAQAGKRGGRVLDEFALHPDPRKLWAIAYPGITWGGSLELVSTHRGSNNFFNQLIREINEGGNPKHISHHKVTLQAALDQGFLYKLQQMLPHDNEIQAMDEAAYFDFVRGGCADEESFQQEYMCNPADDDSAFLEYDLITNAEYAQDTHWQHIEGRDLYMGVDVGRKHDLTVLWVVERLGDVLYTRHVERLKNMPKPQQDAIIYPWIAKCRRVWFDNTGLGIGWVDDAQAKFGAHRIEGINFTTRSKEELAYPVRGRMQDRSVRIPHDPVIRSDLRSVTKTTTTGGHVRFTAERTPDGHADHFWALALAVGAAANPAAPIDYRSTGRRITDTVGGFTTSGFGTVTGGNDFKGFI